MPDLRGARIGLLESRMESELAALVRRHGGEPLSAPSVREAPIAGGAEAAAFIDAIISGRIDVMVLLTAVGVTALLRDAESADGEPADEPAVETPSAEAPSADAPSADAKAMRATSAEAAPAQAQSAHVQAQSAHVQAQSAHVQAQSAHVQAQSAHVQAQSAHADAAPLHAGVSRLSALLDGLRRTTTICRGPKPAGVLARHAVPVGVRVASPHTTADVIATLDTVPLAGRTAGLLHYGERSDAIAEALRARGARVEELCLYEWRLPEDLAPMRRLIRAAIEGRLDALAFTSQIQARHLLRVAAEDGLRDALVSALNGRIVVAAVGPTCASALLSEGITPDVVPDPPKMGPMLAALAAHLEARS